MAPAAAQVQAPPRGVRAWTWQVWGRGRGHPLFERARKCWLANSRDCWGTRHTTTSHGKTQHSTARHKARQHITKRNNTSQDTTLALALSHLLIRSHSLTYSLTYPLTRALTCLLLFSLSHSLTHSLTSILFVVPFFPLGSLLSLRSSCCPRCDFGFSPFRPLFSSVFSIWFSRSCRCPFPSVLVSPPCASFCCPLLPPLSLIFIF